MVKVKFENQIVPQKVKGSIKLPNEDVLISSNAAEYTGLEASVKVIIKSLKDAAIRYL